jgi:hypothetical protein
VEIDNSTQPPTVTAGPGEHVVLTGPVTGIKTLADGTSINVGPIAVLVADQAQADELNDLIVAEHLEHGHPDDVDTLVDPDTGAQVPVQRPFVYEKPDGELLVGTGTAHGEHPLDDANGITKLDGDPRVTGATTTFAKGK